ncbi:MAG: stage V sporulation protein S [Spirochaetia bacterium]|nr:stage V sporulation protein S [Spirochaetia bacterium]
MKLKAAAGSCLKSTAGSLTDNIRNKKEVEIKVMVPNAVNRVMKAAAKAGEYTDAKGVELPVKAGFTHLTFEGEEKSAIRPVIMTGTVRI